MNKVQNKFEISWQYRSSLSATVSPHSLFSSCSLGVGKEGPRYILALVLHTSKDTDLGMRLDAGLGMRLGDGLGMRLGEGYNAHSLLIHTPPLLYFFHGNILQSGLWKCVSCSCTKKKRCLIHSDKFQVELSGQMRLPWRPGKADKVMWPWRLGEATMETRRGCHGDQVI